MADDYGIGYAAQVGWEIGRDIQHRREVQEWVDHSENLSARLAHAISCYERMREDYNLLVDKHNSYIDFARAALAEKDDRYEALRIKYNGLVESFNALKSSDDEVRSQYNELVGDYRTLHATADELRAARAVAQEELSKERARAAQILAESEQTADQYQRFHRGAASRLAASEVLHRALIVELMEQIDPSRLKNLDVIYRAAEMTRLSLMFTEKYHDKGYSPLALSYARESLRGNIPFGPDGDTEPFITKRLSPYVDEQGEVKYYVFGERFSNRLEHVAELPGYLGGAAK